jgi:hypothetical protein
MIAALIPNPPSIPYLKRLPDSPRRNNPQIPLQSSGYEYDPIGSDVLIPRGRLAPKRQAGSCIPIFIEKTMNMKTHPDHCVLPIDLPGLPAGSVRIEPVGRI